VQARAETCAGGGVSGSGVCISPYADDTVQTLR
jgi:hypothetical protein